MMIEQGLLLLVVAGVLQVTIIRYYFASKRKYMQDMLDSLQSGEVS